MDQNKPHFSCPACGRKLPWKAELAGRKGKCKCGQVLTVPAEAAAEAESEFGALEDAAASEAAAPAGCPGCGQAMEPGAVLCLNCGYNVRTGKQIATEVVPGTERAAKVAAAAPARSGRGEEMVYPGRRKRAPAESEATGSTKMYVILGAAVLVVAMGVGGWIIFRGTGGGKANAPRLGDDAAVETMMAENPTKDLAEWITANKARMLGGHNPSQAVALCGRLKEMGATKVLAFGNGVLCLMVAIELPADPAKRKDLFEWYDQKDRERTPTDPPTKDVGQHYLLYHTGL